MAPKTSFLLPVALAVLTAASRSSGQTGSADEQPTWWHLRALDTGEQLAKLEEVSPRQQQVQQAQQQPPPGRKVTVGTVNLAAQYGYTADNHTVHTSDGYILTLFRLANPGKPVVFLAHALLSSSAEFLLLGRSRALALLLHDAGFDVWLFNARGTTPSRNHEHLKPDQAKFWDFSWHEIGALDLPACIDYVLKTTGQPQMHYVGFDQGGTAFFVLGSERPTYMDKIRTFVGLAPLAFTRDVRSFPVRLLAVAPNKLYFILKLIGVNEFLPNSKLMAFLAEMLCSDGEPFQQACSNMLFLLAGTDTQQLNTTALPDLFANVPAGASTKQFLHYGQLVNHRHLVFRQFDYGRAGNLKKYHTVKPPDYDLRKVTAPTYFFFSDNDLLCVQSNIDELARKLPNLPRDGLRKVAYDKFNHLDYILGKNAKEMVYDSLIEILQSKDAYASPGTTSAVPSPTAMEATSATGISTNAAPGTE